MPDYGHFLHTDSFANQLLVIATVPAAAAAAASADMEKELAAAAAIASSASARETGMRNSTTAITTATASSVLYPVDLALTEPIPTSFSLTQIYEWLSNPEVIIQVPYVPPVVEKKVLVTTLGELTAVQYTEEELAAQKQKELDRPFTSSSRPGTSRSGTGTGTGIRGGTAAGTRAIPTAASAASSSSSTTTTTTINTATATATTMVPPLTVPKAILLFDYLAGCGCDDTIVKLSNLN